MQGGGVAVGAGEADENRHDVIADRFRPVSD